MTPVVSKVGGCIRNVSIGPKLKPDLRMARFLRLTDSATKEVKKSWIPEYTSGRIKYLADICEAISYRGDHQLIEDRWMAEVRKMNSFPYGETRTYFFPGDKKLTLSGLHIPKELSGGGKDIAIARYRDTAQNLGVSLIGDKRTGVKNLYYANCTPEIALSIARQNFSCFA